MRACAFPRRGQRRPDQPLCGTSVCLVLGASTGGIGRHVRALVEALGAARAEVTVAGPAETLSRFGYAALGAGDCAGGRAGGMVAAAVRGGRRRPGARARLAGRAPRAERGQPPRPVRAHLAQRGGRGRGPVPDAGGRRALSGASGDGRSGCLPGPGAARRRVWRTCATGRRRRRPAAGLGPPCGAGPRRPRCRRTGAAGLCRPPRAAEGARCPH